MTPKEQLQDLFSKGLIIDIFQTEEALALIRFIGSNAEIINTNNFGNLFGSLQFSLSRQFILALTRLYEQPNSRYPIRGIPSTLDFLDQKADALVIDKEAMQLRNF